MRLAVFVFSLVLVVMPAYVHAIVFVPAVTGALVRTASGVVIKVANKKTLVASAVGLGASTAVDYCKKNKQKCKDWVGDVVEIFFDDDNVDDGDQCKILAYYKGGDQYRTSLSKAISEGLEDKFADSNYHYERTTHNAEAKQKEFLLILKTIKII